MLAALVAAGLRLGQSDNEIYLSGDLSHCHNFLCVDRSRDALVGGPSQLVVIVVRGALQRDRLERRDGLARYHGGVFGGSKMAKLPT